MSDDRSRCQSESTTDGDEQPEARTDVLFAMDERLAAGEEPSSGPSIPDPELADDPQFQRGLDCLRLLDRLRPGRPGTTGSALERDDSSWRHGDPTRIGRFQIRRKLGHGGFGVVYLAYDPKLRRQVALKVPHPRTILTAELRERFQREASAAAALDHPNVVPVFDSGEAGPVCFIAAAYCAGISLATWLRGRTDAVPARSAAALIAQVADGVQHAHERGILHRDLKPGNVLLTPLRAGKPIEESSTLEMSAVLAIDPLEFLPRITDFGMAKRVGEWESDGSINDDPAAPLTKTGAVMGTPTYMAPEQAAGRTKDISTATDVHALGVLLYEMLTGQTPFLAESTYDTLRRVQQDEPLAPSKLRPRLPRDLETICLKCLQKEPKRRYQTAKELAEDLRRFLESKAIHARSVGRAERAWRWSAREPVVAGLLMALVLVIIGGLLGLSWLFMDARHQAKLAREGERNANVAKLAEAQARSKVEEHLQQIRTLMDNVTTVTRSLSFSDPAQRKLRQQVLEDLLKFHEMFLVEKGDDPAILHESAQTYQNVANLRVELGYLDEAEDAYRRTRLLFEKIEELAPLQPRYRLSRAWYQYWNGYFLARRRQKFKEAEASFQAGIQILESLLEETPGNTEAKRSLAVTLMNWSGIQFRSGKSEIAERGYRDAERLLREVMVDWDNNLGVREDLAITIDSLAECLMDRRRLLERSVGTQLPFMVGAAAPIHLMRVASLKIELVDSEANRASREAVAIMRKLVASATDRTPYLFTLTRVRNRLAAFLFRSRNPEMSQKQFLESISTMQQVVAQNPDAVDYRLLLADTLAAHAFDLPSDKNRDAILYFRQAIGHMDRLVSRFPEVSEYKSKQARYTSNLVYRLTVDQTSDALTALENLVKAQPENALAVNNLGWFLAWRPDGSLADRERALELAQRSMKLNPGNSYYDCLNTLGFCYFRLGDLAAARTTLERCVKERPDPLPEDRLFISMVYARQGEVARARDHYNAALRMIKHENTSREWPLLKAEAEKLIENPPRP